MHKHDLMKPDLLSEIVLVASGLALFVSLLWILIAGLSQTN
jgi:hypothetical protein